MNKMYAGMSVVSAALAVGFSVAAYNHPKVHSLAELQASTVSLQMASGATCSGWVRQGTHEVVTAAHCVADEPKSPVAVDFHDGTGLHVFVANKIGDINGVKPDLAVLTTKDDKIKWPEGLPLCNFKPYYLESVFLFGDPLGYQKVITTGNISNPSQAVPQARDTPYIQYDGSLTPGNSGGAVVDIKYQCVIASADALLEAPNGDSLKFLEPADRLGELK